MQARRAYVRIVYESKDITRDIASDLIAFAWNDNESGTADDISISLRNDHKRWINGWYPRVGDTIQASIVLEEDGLTSTVYCGRFSVDELEAQHPPSTFTINAVSIPLDTSARRTRKTKAWEDVSLEDIAKDIAVGAGLSLFFDAPNAPRYDRLDQRQESDLAFLLRACTDAGLCLKVTDDRIVVFDEARYEQRTPVAELAPGDGLLVSWSFRAQAFDLYSSVTCSYYDAEKNETIEVKVEDPNITDAMQSRITRRAKSIGEAQRLARAELRRLNRNETEGSLSVVGDTSLVAGAVVSLSGVGAFSGQYLINKATHQLESSGYQTTLEVHRVIKGDY